jgi:hypothetical protein
MLLHKGWRVVAVDSSRAALAVLREKADSLNPRWTQSGQLSLIEENMGTFSYRQQVDLVLAVDSLPYMNPAEFMETWRKVGACVKENGFFVGTLFRLVRGADPLLNIAEEMGAWHLPDRRMVRPLLTDAGFAPITVQYRNDPQGATEATCIQFIGKKGSAPAPLIS